MGYDFNVVLRNDIMQVTYDVGAHGEENLLMVARMVGNDWYIKEFHGEDADFVYELLTTKSVPKAIRDWCEKEYKENGW